MKDRIIQAFPNLRDDKYFAIKSDPDSRYNCIAWAAIRDNICWWPHDPRLDGTDWPFGLPKLTNLECFIELYRHLHYEICDDWKFEDGFQKIAIYQNSNGEGTHAARQKSDGLWTSKLGIFHDIVHGSPHGLEGSEYGTVAVVMRRENPGFKLSALRIKNS